MTRPALPFGHPAALFGTWFGAGLLPVAPGTWGSLAALPFAWAMMRTGGPLLLLVAAALATALGWWATARYLEATDVKDPGEVVIDEVAAQWLTLTIADPAVWWQWALGFALFRLFDITKPWPANVIDRGRGAFAVMADDTVAALYALVVLALAIHGRSLFGGG